MKRFLFIILSFCFLSPQSIFAQNENKGGYDKISGGMTIETVKYKEKVKKKKVRKPLKPVEKGLQHNVTWGMYSNFDGENFLDFNFDYIIGYRVNNYLYAGAGIGFDFNIYGSYVENLYTIHKNYYNGFYTPFFSIPLYAHCRIYMSKKRFQPFFALSMGGDIRFPLREETGIYAGGRDDNSFYLTDAKYTTSGLFIEPMLGLDVRLSSKVSINMQLGSKISSLPYELKFTDPTHAYIANKTLPTLSFKLGCTF